MSYDTINTNAEKIRKMLVKDYHFEGFMHETSISNLCSILKCGLLKSRSEAENFDDSADKNVLKHTDKSVFEKARFYFFKKTPTNHAFDRHNPDGMVYIVFDWDIIFQDNALIANGNASSSYTTIKSVKDYLNNPNDFMDWDRITHRSILPSFPPAKFDIVRKRNAEMIIPKGVSTKYIDRIVFKSEKALKEFKKKLNDDTILLKFEKKIAIDKSYFYSE